MYKILLVSAESLEADCNFRDTSKLKVFKKSAL